MLICVIEHGQGKMISSIRDTGPGIAPENLKKIFEEFYRADKNTPGSGLGLYIAYTIAKLHQGEIQVESQLGHRHHLQSHPALLKINFQFICF